MQRTKFAWLLGGLPLLLVLQPIVQTSNAEAAAVLEGAGSMARWSMRGS